MNYIIRNNDEMWDVSAEELSALHLQPGDSICTGEFAASLSRAAIPNDLRGWLIEMISAAPEQIVYVEEMENEA